MKGIYWHVTPTTHVDSILKTGISVSEDGHFGEGVYCINRNDLNTLQVILNAEWYRDEGIKFEDLSIVEFIYHGNKIESHIPVMTNYRDEQWILIKSKIHQDCIIKILKSEDFIELKYQ